MMDWWIGGLADWRIGGLAWSCGIVDVPTNPTPIGLVRFSGFVVYVWLCAFRWL